MPTIIVYRRIRKENVLPCQCANLVVFDTMLGLRGYKFYWRIRIIKVKIIAIIDLRTFWIF